MRRRRCTLPFAVACLVAGVTAAAAHAGWHKKDAPSAEAPPPLELPLAERGSLEPDLASVPSSPPPPFFLIEGDIRYRLLRASECQCQAVYFSATGNLLARERNRLADANRCCENGCLQFLLPRQCDQSAVHLKIAILYFSELEARNRAAGLALELYYKLAESEAKTDLVKLAAADLDDAVRRTRELMQQGFKLPIEITTLQRQEIDARVDRAKLAGGIVELNGRLKGMIGQEHLPFEERLWPAGDFEVAFSPLDVDEAIRIALENRPELNLLRTVQRDLDTKTLSVVRDFLKGLNGLLGASATPSTLIKQICNAIKEFVSGHGGEKSLRQTQLQQLLADRERAIADEVRLAAADWHTKGQLVVLGRERALAAAARQREAQDMARSGSGSFLDVLNANLEAYKARGQLVEDLMGWHAARARLKMAQGVLVLECCRPRE